MSEVVLGDDGRAVIHNRETGQVLKCSVPTALENVANGKGVWAHGEGDGETVAPSAPVPAPEPEPAILLTEPDVLPLPEPAPEPEPEPVPAAAPPASDPLDHDGDGKKGGAKKPADPERAEVIAALKAAKIKFFAGAPTAKLKTLLPG